MRSVDCYTFLTVSVITTGFQARTTAIVFPEEINMQEELEMITKAAREAYEAHFPGEGGL